MTRPPTATGPRVLLRSRGDLQALVDRCCEVTGEQDARDPIMRGGVLHADALQLLDWISMSITGLGVHALVAQHSAPPVRPRSNGVAQPAQ